MPIRISLSGNLKIGVEKWFVLIMTTSVSASVFGIVYGALHDPNGGGRGGAIGVMVAFFALFVRSNLAVESYRATAEVLPQLHSQLQGILSELAGAKPISDSATLNGFAELQAGVNGILSMLNGIEAEQNRMNFCIASASFVSTLLGGSVILRPAL